MKNLIINADDYGLNPHCTKAIAMAFRDHCISDTTIMATGMAFEEALSIAKQEGFLNQIGIHFNLTEGTPLTDSIKQCDLFVKNGVFHAHINRLKPLTRAEKIAVYHELSAQIEKLENAGVTATHADSHHHIHTALFLAPIVLQVCREHQIDKIRLHRNMGSVAVYKKAMKNAYNHMLRRKGFVTTAHFGSFEDISTGVLPDQTEIMVHPDFDRNGVLIDRVKEDDGFPVGQPLPNLYKKQGILQIDYTCLH